VQGYLLPTVREDILTTLNLIDNVTLISKETFENHESHISGRRKSPRQVAPSKPTDFPIRIAECLMLYENLSEGRNKQKTKKRNKPHINRVTLMQARYVTGVYRSKIK
jgi:hypothetical protein